MNSFEQSPSRSDVAFLFEELLGRKPAENDVNHFVEIPTLEQLYKLFRSSAEARHRHLALLSKEHLQDNLSHDIEWKASRADVLSIVQHTQKVWERYGRDEAYFSVLTNPIFKPECLDYRTVELFYSTGADEANLVRRLCASCDVEIDPNWTVLELGCGLGRITEHLGAYFAHVTGVDVSKHHLVQAAQRLAEKRRSNVTLTLLSDFLASDIKTDLFVSFLVLQHNAPPVIASLLENCLGRLNRGGVAIFQCLTTMFDYRFDLADYLAKIGQSVGPMEMHALPQPVIMAIARAAQCHPLLVLPDGHGSNLGISYTFVMRKA